MTRRCNYLFNQRVVSDCVIFCLSIPFQATPATRASTIAAFQDIKAIKESERRVIGGYIVEEVIGKGAFGTVYQVRSLTL